MTIDKKRKHLVSLPRDLYQSVEALALGRGQSIGDLTRQVLTCWLERKPLPDVPVPAPAVPAKPVAQPTPRATAAPPMRADPAVSRSAGPLPSPVAAETPSTAAPDIDFDSPSSEALARAQQLLGSARGGA